MKSRELKLTIEELEYVKEVVRPTVTTVRRKLLQTISSERRRHRKMIAPANRALNSPDRRMGFRRGFDRGLCHAENIVRELLKPARFTAHFEKASSDEG